MDHSEDPHALSEQLEREAEELESRSHELEHEIDAARTDWERKRADPSVPGAPPHREETDAQRTGRGAHGTQPEGAEHELDASVAPDDQPAAG
jgi:hypothetical protein